MRRMIMCAALSASALLGATGAALAEDGQMRVQLAGLNLSTESGAQVALARIRYQAGLFCEAGAGRTSLDRSMASAHCQKAITKTAVDQLHSRMVTALYNGTPLSAPADGMALAAR